MNGLTILVAGPYRSGTNDDPALMRKNLLKLEEVTLDLFRAGHLPVIGEWVAFAIATACRFESAWG